LPDKLSEKQQELIRERYTPAHSLENLANGIEAFFGTAPDSSNPGIAKVKRSGNTVTFTHPEAKP